MIFFREFKIHRSLWSWFPELLIFPHKRNLALFLPQITFWLSLFLLFAEILGHVLLVIDILTWNISNSILFLDYPLNWIWIVSSQEIEHILLWIQSRVFFYIKIQSQILFFSFSLFFLLINILLISAFERIKITISVLFLFCQAECLHSIRSALSRTGIAASRSFHYCLRSVNHSLRLWSHFHIKTSTQIIFWFLLFLLLPCYFFCKRRFPITLDA